MVCRHHQLRRRSMLLKVGNSWNFIGQSGGCQWKEGCCEGREDDIHRPMAINRAKSRQQKPFAKAIDIATGSNNEPLRKL